MILKKKILKFLKYTSLSYWVVINHTNITHKDFRGRAHWLLILGNNTDVEDSREDEDKTRSRCCTWKRKNRTNID